MQPRVALAAGVLAATVGGLLLLGGEDAGDPDRAPSPAVRLVRTATAQELGRCRAETRGRTVAACPSTFPRPGGFERARQFERERCHSLVNYEPRDVRGPGVFHLIVAARCGALSLRARAGRWPATYPARRDMRLLGVPEPQGRLVVLRRTTVRGRPALLLRNPPYPAGGIHGGHLTVLFVRGDSSYAVTGHPTIPAALRGPDGELASIPMRAARRVLPHERRAAAQLLAVAAGVSPT